MEQVNQLLRSELANLVSKEVYLQDGLITITHVKCSPDLKNASILISVLPENLSGTALKTLNKFNSLFSNELRKKLNLKFIPKFTWKIDSQERYAAEIDKAFAELKNENDES